MRNIIIFLFFFLGFIGLEANNIQVLNTGPIHEAYVTQESGNIILQAVPDKPPAPITEDVPQSADVQAIWIPGYWSWLRDPGEFIWVSGIWRRPPPNCQWIAGYWKQYQYGWVWFPGFWSQKSEREFKYIPKPPPEPLDEKVPLPPQPASAYFWAPGYWEWNEEAETFRWLSGKWASFNQHWIYVPARYYWREKGYIFVSGGWDWTMEDRGFAFANVSIKPEAQSEVVYEPSSYLSPLWVMEKLFPYWPNYSCLFYYHFYYHYNLWISWGAIPPWWQWSTWWCLVNQDAWWLWWWWVHPGYPNPPWLNEKMAEMIYPPMELTLKVMKDIKPPPTVTPNGAVGSAMLIKAIEQASGKPYPILPSDPKQIQQIQELAVPKASSPPYLRPSGKEKKQELLKPNNETSKKLLKLPPGRVKIPPAPIPESQ